MEHRNLAAFIRSPSSFTSVGRKFLVAFLFVVVASMGAFAQSATPSSVTPSSGSGSAQLFTVNIGDANGGGDVAEEVLNIMANVVPGVGNWSAHECLLR